MSDSGDESDLSDVSDKEEPRKKRSGQHSHTVVATPELATAIRAAHDKKIRDWRAINQHILQVDPALGQFASKNMYYRTLGFLNITPPMKALVRGPALASALASLKDADGRRGYRGKEHALSLAGVNTSRKAVLKVMGEIDPEGMAARRLGANKKKMHRTPLENDGPDEQWSMDGHDKLKMHGFEIYGIVDVFSGKVLAMHVFNSNRLAVNVYWLWIKTIREIQGIPISVATDFGDEATLVRDLQKHLRLRLSGPELDDKTPYVKLPSTRNITVERGWVPVVRDVDRDVKDLILKGSRLGYISLNPIHFALFKWLFAPLVQQKVDHHVLFHNTFHVRKQRDKLNPSNGCRADMYDYPERFGGTSQRQVFGPVESATVEEQYRKACDVALLRFVDSKTQGICEQAAQVIGAEFPSVLDTENAWPTFFALLPWVRQPLQYLLE